MNEWVVEVQHSSDFKRDGVWYEIDHGDDVYINNPKNPEISRLAQIATAYAGRPVRARKLENDDE